MSAESPRHARAGGPLTVPAQPPSDRSLIDAVSGFINDVTLSSSTAHDPKDVIQWARFETADINEPTPEGDSDNDISPLLLILGYGSGVQVWLIPPSGEAQEVLSWRQGTVRVLRILPTPQHGDCYASKRPLIALCDSASPGPSFCSLSFISIRGGEQVKSIKFKNPILDVLANKRSVVVSFSERFAVFDAATLEDRLAVTTCYPCPCPLGGSSPINPLALGDRWLAYADKKLNQSKRSSGGCEGEGQTSYTATVLHAAKSLSKGLRGLGETVAHSLAGGRSTSQSPSPPNADSPQPGVITVLDIETNDEEEGQDAEEQYDPIVAHFIAHSEAIIALKFDPSGMLLITADRRGHDFHVFRINPHPCGPALASVHHLYILHRGDTTAKVQDIAVSLDSRWAAISTLRGTTHVFALSAYGGSCGVRTHTAPRVLNRLSRFHRSAGLPIHAAHPPPHSPVSEGAGVWFPNPRLPPYPVPTVNAPLAQLRATAALPTHTITRTSSGRQRLSSLSEDSNTVPLLARARFGTSGPPPAVPPGALGAGGASKAPAAASLYLMSAGGCLSHIALHPRPTRSVPKEKICDDTPIELEVEPLAQWPLQRVSAAAADLLAPLPPSNPLLQPLTCRRYLDMCMSEEERWLSQVEIVTHAGPHRRLWMGPQFVFKTYNLTGSNSSLSEAETVEVVGGSARGGGGGVVGGGGGCGGAGEGVARSNPVNVPHARPIVPVLIDSGSASSLEHSPSDGYRRKSLLAESGRAASVCDVQLKEDLAEAMKEEHGSAAAERRRAGGGGGGRGGGGGGVCRLVDPAGTVLEPAAGAGGGAGDVPAPPLQEHARANCDEATFRAVVRAPAPAAPHLTALEAARPLPHTTTIPAEHAVHVASSPDRAVPLSTDVIIPAALSDAAASLPMRRSADDIHPPPVVARVKRSPTPQPFSGKDSEVSCKEVIRRLDLSETVESKELEKSKELKQSKVLMEPQKPMEAKELVEPKDYRKADALKEFKKPRGSNEPKELETSATKKLMKCEDLDAPKELIKTEETNELKKIEKSEGTNEVRELIKPKVSKVVKENDPIHLKKLKEKDLKDSMEPDIAKILKEPIELPFPKESNITKQVKEQTELPELKEQKDRKELREHKERKETKERKDRKEVRDQKEIKELHKQKDIKQLRELEEFKETKEVKLLKEQKVPKESRQYNDLKDIKEREMRKSKDARDCKSIRTNMDAEDAVSLPKKPVEELRDIDLLDDRVDESARHTVAEEPETVSFNLPARRESDVERKNREDEIKTEDQAWDMLLNEHERAVSVEVTPSLVEEKPKVKKNKKSKKYLDDAQAKADDDSFVEIHAIEEKPQECGSELVSISTPFEDVEHASFILKTKRSRKSLTPEKKDESKSIEILPQEIDLLDFKSKYNKKYEDKDIEVLPSPVELPKEFVKATTSSNAWKPRKHSDCTTSESSSFFAREISKPSKSKSLSPYPELRKFDKPAEKVEKDVYVINTAEDDFPEIQITRASKPRKKSPQPIERKNTEREVVVDKPSKLWSSIAASKNVKKVEEATEKKGETLEAKKYVSNEDENPMSSTTVSLQDKLIELCKRTDIMVAECDTPSELNFVEEHHAVLHDLPPLEPLDFGLDDFKLEVMRDSLLEVNETNITSPICKINIDDILSSIKETTARAIESSAFNLIDLEKVLTKKEKGFSVIEEHKITSQEVKLDDDIKEEKEGDMEKSSEDDTSPIVSTDSDKEDKKNAGAANIVLPSSKQSAKSKKSRRKKK